ncbi:hypothetical protein [Parerythrobacter lacustris]|uniref:Lipoprotein n=1 Tax=Parerythrobacter lacustris TaxID=2969984 RepID=A0ABT1XT69_9SPHN|nr:hypothetical protein [Parerythrobacter lacustris]MCR2834449.1 hypothetical protein [Parerythrobacter lacustris]
MRGLSLFLVTATVPLLGGCLAKAAADIVTAPVRIASGAVDLATTSQSEADEKRGREIREREERLGKLDRRYRQLDEDCTDGDRSACLEAREVWDEMEELNRTIPATPPPRDD